MMASAPLSGSLIDDLEDEDNDQGFERDETEGRLRVLIPASARAAALGARAPRNNGLWQCDRCGGWFGVTSWTCSACQQLASLVPAFEDRPPLPIRPKPHERDGRQDSPDTGGRPHPQQATDRARLAAETSPRQPGWTESDYLSRPAPVAKHPLDN
ncbi:hypothetical protein AB0898_29930 [Streptomyces sp. NPDC005435]